MFSSQQSQVSSDTLYVEDVFSAYTYTGNGSTQTITNGIDLAGNGGLVWTKHRNAANYHYLCDTARTRAKGLFSNDTGAEQTSIAGRDIASFDSTGYTLGQDYAYTANSNAQTFISWTFRKAAKFFDVVTYTGTGVARTLSHSLGQAPGMILVKCTSTTGNWAVYHRANTANPETDYLLLNTTAATADLDTYWNDTAPTSAVFSVGTHADVNTNGATYVAYLFGHDTSATGLIQCGSFTTDGSENSSTTLGWEPQLLLIKKTNTTQDWYLADSMRGLNVAGVDDRFLYPNLSNAEGNNNRIGINATGFTTSAFGASASFIYMAIRRGPMRAPTSGTQVYNAIARTGTGAAATVTGVGFAADLGLFRPRNLGTLSNIFHNRLSGITKYLFSGDSGAEVGPDVNGITSFDMSGYTLGGGSTGWNNASYDYINHFFRRAPGFFDEVCYTGTGAAHTEAHNLGVVPELMIVKRRDDVGGWVTYHSSITAANELYLNTTAASVATSNWNSTSPTSSVFSVGSANVVNGNTFKYVTFLFATLAGISKVGSYTGTGTTKQVDCGFAAGARFVLIKRTDSTGDWYLWDSVRGIIAGNDPFLLINSTAAENTATDYIDPLASGFEISSTAPAAINASGGTFIYLAFA